MTYGQAGAVCPQCGSAAAVHSIAEWVAMARGPMGGQWQPGSGPVPQPGYGPPQPGYPASPGPGPQSGFPDPSQYQQSGFPDPSQYQQSGFPDPSQYQQPGSAGPSQDPPSASAADPSHDQPPESQPPASQPQPPLGQQPGYPAAGPWPPGQQPGYPEESWQSQPPPRRSGDWGGAGSDVSLGDGIGEAVVGAAMGFLGRAIGRRVRRTVEERVLPAMAAKQDQMMRTRIAIAERHPDLCACLNDQVIFLAGGTRVLPLAAATRVTTVEQGDALVAQLRNG
ncbi:MAG TPA: hypothetical protein VIY52_02565 [Streptosporangiaceae bacterium]